MSVVSLSTLFTDGCSVDANICGGACEIYCCNKCCTRLYFSSPVRIMLQPAPFCSISVVVLDDGIACVKWIWPPVTYWGCDAMYLICIVTQNLTHKFSVWFHVNPAMSLCTMKACEWVEVMVHSTPQLLYAWRKRLVLVEKEGGWWVLWAGLAEWHGELCLWIDAQTTGQNWWVWPPVCDGCSLKAVTWLYVQR